MQRFIGIASHNTAIVLVKVIILMDDKTVLLYLALQFGLGVLHLFLMKTEVSTFVVSRKAFNNDNPY